MTEEKLKSDKPFETTLGTKIAYAHGALADNLALQNFIYLGFTFYFAVAGLPVVFVSIGFIIYALWDGFNDLFIGVISDRTKTKYGRRKPWIYFSTLPLCLIMVLIWMPPSGILLTFIYFVILLIIYDFVFTTYTVNFNALWPEMFLNVDDRNSVEILRIMFTIIGVAIAFLIPELIIEDIANKRNLPQTPLQYILNGIIAAIIVFITIAIMLKFGSFERKEFSKDGEGVPSWKESYKITFKNKTFMIYTVVAFSVFTVYNIFLIIIPLYAVFVLKMEDPGMILFVGLLFGVFSAPLWRVLRKKWGIRKTYMVSLAFWAFTLLLLAFASDEIIGFMVVTALGFGLGGSMYLYDLGIAEIIDDDEVRSGFNVRREGVYYGVIAFFNRLSIAINVLIIGIIFVGTGWGEYNPRPGADIILGLRFLVGIWPAIILCIGIICLYFYPIHGERLKENEKMLKELHSKKKYASNKKIIGISDSIKRGGR